MKATKIGPFGMGIVYDYETIIKSESSQVTNPIHKEKKVKKTLKYQNNFKRNNYKR